MLIGGSFGANGVLMVAKWRAQERSAGHTNLRMG